jgi:hypothetical protein
MFIISKREEEEDGDWWLEISLFFYVYNDYHLFINYLLYLTTFIGDFLYP